MSHCVFELNSKEIFNCLLITAVEPLILLHAAAAADDDDEEQEEEEDEDDCEGDGDGDDDENDGICIILRQMWRIRYEAQLETEGRMAA